MSGFAASGTFAAGYAVAGVEHNLAAAAVVQAVAGASLSRVVTLGAAAVVQAVAGASLSRVVALGAAAVAEAVAGASLSRVVALGAAAVAEAVASASLSRVVALGAAAVAEAVAAAVLQSGSMGQLWVFGSVPERQRWTASNRHRGLALWPHVLGPLRVGELKVVAFDFGFDLPEGAVVASASVVCVLRRGVDEEPEALLQGDVAVVGGRVVHQVVSGRVAGCLYGLKAMAGDSAGGLHVVHAWLPCTG